MPAVLQAHGVYWLNSAAGINVDVTCFEALVDTGNQRARAGDTAEAIAFYNRALALYRGDLCMATDAQVVVEREHLRGRYLSMLAHLARLDYARGDYTSCLSHTMRLLAYDPCREDAYRLIMRCYVRLGERAQALRQYRLCETILHTEFGAVPEPATTALFDCIRLNPANMETALLLSVERAQARISARTSRRRILSPDLNCRPQPEPQLNLSRTSVDLSRT